MSSFCPRVLRSFVPCLLLASVTAQWRSLPVNTAPPINPSPTLAPTPGGDLFLFGSLAANDWLWSGTHWSSITTPVPRRRGHAMAVAGNGDIVLFGGLDAASAPVFDVWRFDGNTWQQTPTTTSPPSMNAMSMAYDPATDAMILVGQPGLGVYETWSLDNDWSQVAAPIPAGTLGTWLYSDSVRGAVGAFNRRAQGFDVTELSNGTWEVRASDPAGINPATVAFDARRGRAVMFQQSGSGPGSVYEFDGLTIRAAAASGLSNVLVTRAMAYDARRGETVLIGDVGTQMAAFSWSPAPVPFTTAYGDPCVDPQLVLSLAPGDQPALGATHRLVAPTPSSVLTWAVLGFSHTQDGPALLPQPLPGSLCLQRVGNLIALRLITSPGSLQITVPNDPGLSAVRYDAQFFTLDASGLADATNGLELQLAPQPVDSALTEDFTTSLARDPDASGDTWGGGTATPALIGGDGRHGSFDPSLGTMTAPNTWVFDTASILIPASHSLNGQSYLVTDGKFYFTDLRIAAGDTVQFVGPVPPQIRVRGKVEIAGSLQLNGADMTPFNARGATATAPPFVIGQPGGAPGAGGGFGGRGGDECQGTGPIIVAGEVRTDGADGENVQLLAGHAYAAQAVGTGGQGSAMNPPTGVAFPNTPLVGFVYRSYFAPGGSGGGFSLPGSVATVTPLPNQQIGPVAAGGVAFNPLPVPAAFGSLNHFTIGGSGGGGGATHAFGTIYVSGDVYIAGSAGSGGGGAAAIRAGSDVTVAIGASCESKGGAGALINARNPSGSPANTDWGISSPGGGGSGGSFLFQAGGNLTIAGAIDTSGGGGSRTGGISTASLNVQSQAGAGSPGFYRLEAAGSLSVSGTGVPAYNASTNSGPLTDRDDRTGSRSLWLRPSTLELPRYVRYELLADVNGVTVLYSDDLAVSNVAADDPNGAVYLRFQGAQVDPVTGAVLPATAGPWRTHVIDGPGTLNSDRAQALRFDFVLDKSFGPIQVLELRVIWR